MGFFTFAASPGRFEQACFMRQKLLGDTNIRTGIQEEQRYAASQTWLPEMLENLS